MKETTAIGLMSGSSLDGLDIALVKFKKEGEHYDFQILAAETQPYPDFWKTQLSEAFHKQPEELTQLDKDYGRYLGEQVLAFAKKHNATPDFVASHGHTIFHKPEQHYTLQIGDGQELAKACGFLVINDFRSEDVSKGGQGAPLVPIGDKLLFSDYEICLNIGGIANVSYDENGQRIAYDLCIANQALNYLAQMGKAGGKKLTIKGRKPKAPSTTGAVSGTTQSVAGTTQQVGPALGRFDPASMVEEEKEGMGIGKMVGLAIGGVVVAITALVGGLLWWMHSSTVSQELEEMNTARAVMIEARNAATQNQKIAFDYCEKIKGCAESSEKDMNAAIATLKGLLTEEHLSAYGDQLIPDPSTNKDVAEAMAYVESLAQAKAPAKAEQPAEAAAPAAKEGEAKEGEAKAEETKEGEAKEGEAKEGETKEGEAPAEGAQEGEGGDEGGEGEAAAEPAAPPVELPGSAKELIKMWDDAYLCRAAAIRVSARMDDLLKKADGMLESARSKESEADSMDADLRNERKALYEEAAQLYGQAGKMLKDTYDAVRGEKINETAQMKAKSLSDKAKRRLDAIEKDIAKQKATAEKKRLAALEAEQKAAERVEAERVKKEKEAQDIALAQTAFEDLISGRLRQLSWEPAIARLKSVRGEMETVAGQDEVDFMIWKVEIMRDLQLHFIKFAKGTQFPNKVRTTIVAADQKKFTIQNHTWNPRKGDFDVDPKTADIDWSRLYRASDEAYKGVRLDWILTKMLQQLVEKGRESNRSDLKAALPLKVWTDRLLGAALTLKLLYSDKQGAPEYAAKLAKMAVKAFPDYAEKRAKKLFPDIDFSDAGEGEE